ncbi:TPA: hypothetical protein ACM245_001114, partial [Neisseria meningitidis]
IPAKTKKIKNTKLKYRHSRAGGNLGLSVRKLIGKTVFPNLRLRIPVFAGIRFFEFQSFLINSCSFEFLDSRFCGNDAEKLL